MLRITYSYQTKVINSWIDVIIKNHGVWWAKIYEAAYNWTMLDTHAFHELNEAIKLNTW